MSKENSPRPASVIRAEREKVNQKIVELQKLARSLSDELRSVEGPIPHRSRRDTQFRTDKR